jgi:hypothetical protein
VKRNREGACRLLVVSIFACILLYPDLTIIDDHHKAAPKPSLTDERGDDDMGETSKASSPSPSEASSEKSSDKEPTVEEATPAEASAQVIETSSESSDTVRDEEG